MDTSTTDKVQPGAVIDHRFGEPGARCYGFVWFGEGGGSEGVRIGYTTGQEPELWQGDWTLALPGHFQAAADALIKAGILIPRDGRVSVRFADWDDSHLVRADAIGTDLRTLIWARRPHGRRA